MTFLSSALSPTQVLPWPLLFPVIEAPLSVPAWHGWVAPQTLVSQVRNTAPFLFRCDAKPESRSLPEILHNDLDAPFEPGLKPSTAFLDILYAAEVIDWSMPGGDPQLIDYFTLCLACHHASVATFVPTDVDTKIRGLIWRRTRDREVLRRMAHIGLASARWNLSGVSRRTTEIAAFGPVSGHDGEWLSVIAGAHGRFLQLGDGEWAERTGDAIDAELRRQLAAFETALSTRGAELDTLRLSTSITHNLGDLDQGISFWEGRSAPGVAESLRHFHRLAHENKAAYEGGFQVPAGFYKKALASEGHRHYPLRAVRPLRQSADLLLPLGPYLDDWGATLMRFPNFSHQDRAEVIDALVRGCRKIAGQQGYFRALAGMISANHHLFEESCAYLPAASKKDLRSPDIRRLTAIPQSSFESRLKKVVRP